MGVIQCFFLALKSLSTSKMRAFLTMLGIIIGVAAVIVIMSLGNGLTVYVNDVFSELGTTTVNVIITGRGSTRNVDADDMYELYESNTDTFSAVSPVITVSGRVRTSLDTDTYNPTMTGIGEMYLDANKLKLDSGRNITYIDVAYNKKVCIAGAFYDYLYNGDTLGQRIKINGDNYTIIGVLEEKGDKTDENGSDNVLYLPYSTAGRFLARTANISTYIFVADGEEKIDDAKRLIKDRLYKTFRNDDLYAVISNSEILDSMNEMIGIIVSVLAGIAAISLVVGGIGIMNIMLVSVTERTREIGIRKALGAKGRHIKLQFVIEAGTTSAIGGVIGIGLGVLAARAASMLIEDFTAVPTAFAVILSFGISVAVGIIFGYLPARKAAKLNPIESLRHE